MLSCFFVNHKIKIYFTDVTISIVKRKYFAIFPRIFWPMKDPRSPLDRAHRVPLGTRLERLELIPERILAGFTRISCSLHLRVVNDCYLNHQYKWQWLKSRVWIEKDNVCNRVIELTTSSCDCFPSINVELHLHTGRNIFLLFEHVVSHETYTYVYRQFLFTSLT